MKKSSFGLLCLGLAGALSIGCGDDGDPPPTGTDAGTDAGPMCTPVDVELPPTGTPPASPTCNSPADGVPGGEGACCYLDSQADNQASPELRLRYLNILAPQGSSLMSPVLLGVLNNALATNTFAWLVKVDGADADGPITIRTGFGLTRTDGTYAFPAGTTDDELDDPTRYAPAELTGTLSGERFQTERHTGSLTVPVLTTDGSAVQLELVLRNIRVLDGELNTDRSCVGFVGPRNTYVTGALLDGFIEVESARGGHIMLPTGGETTICAAIAGRIGDAEYCETTPQESWTVPPDSLCTSEGCTANTDCEEDVCSRTGSGSLPACNAWRLVAGFAAHGVEIAD